MKDNMTITSSPFAISLVVGFYAATLDGAAANPTTELMAPGSMNAAERAETTANVICGRSAEDGGVLLMPVGAENKGSSDTIERNSQEQPGTLRKNNTHRGGRAEIARLPELFAKNPSKTEILRSVGPSAERFAETREKYATHRIYEQ